MIENINLLHPRVASSLSEHSLDAEVMSCDPALADTAEFCKSYNIPAEETCNAIIAASKTDPIKYACCIILATCKLDVNKVVCRLLEVKKCSFASADQTKALTDMEIGGVTPIGVSGIPIFIDARVMNNKRVVLGGGNRTSKLLVNPEELRKIPGLEVVDELAILRTE